MKVLFVAHGDFFSNSSVHIFGFANQLVRLGYECAVAVPGNKASVSNIGTPMFSIFEFSECTENFFRPDIIHCWSPREHVRLFTENIRRHHPSKLVVHLEDNEVFLTESLAGVPIGELAKLSDTELSTRIPPNLSHPRHYKQFLQRADAVTVIIDSLSCFVPNGKPVHTLHPGVDFNLFSPRAELSRHSELTAISATDCVISYTGNVHAANASEVRKLYDAIYLMNNDGISTRIIRTGSNHVNFLGNTSNFKFELNLGIINWHEIPGILARADILVQPGRDDAFNRYRLPSKLPEYFATGKPVILPHSNIGRGMTDGYNAVLLYTGMAEEIAAAAAFLFKHERLKKQIGQNGRIFAMNTFSWERNTSTLSHFYEKLFAESDTLDQAKSTATTLEGPPCSFISESDAEQAELVSKKWQAALHADTASTSQSLADLRQQLKISKIRYNKLRHTWTGRLVRILLRRKTMGTWPFLKWAIRNCLNKQQPSDTDVILEFEQLLNTSENHTPESTIDH
jgi:glycosyltransferase involved in cell wall biosynthesis